jgi:hypothetical protein
MIRVTLLRLKLLGLMALLLLAPFSSKADDTDTQKDHVQLLANQAKSTKDNLGDDVVNIMSLGGLNFMSFGDKASSFNAALDAHSVSNPNEADSFISRIAGGTQSEESNGWCDSDVVVGFNDSGSFVRTLFPPSPSPSMSLSFNGWSQSTDAGNHFTDKGILLPDPLPPGSRFVDLFGDPVVDCTDNSTFYYSSLATDIKTNRDSFSAISVSKSTDGGATFGGAMIAVEKFSRFPVLHNLDKEWMTVNRVGGADHVHVTYTDFSFGSCAPFTPGTSIEYVRSIDGGHTWSAPIVIDSLCGFGPFFLQGSHVAVGPSGEIYVAWEYYPNGIGPGRQIKIRRSSDGGTTFGPAVVVSNVTAVGTGYYVQGFFRDFLDFQGLAVDRSGGPHNGQVYIAWQDGRNLAQTDPFGGTSCLTGSPATLGYCFGDILLASSTNGGLTWSPPVRVNDDPITLKVDQMFPAVDVDNHGQVFVVFYDRRRDSRNYLIDTEIAVSDDGGSTWDNKRVTKNNFAAIHYQDVVVNPVYMGDYLGISADRTGSQYGVIVSWGDNSLGNPNVVAKKTTRETEDETEDDHSEQ